MCLKNTEDRYAAVSDQRSLLALKPLSTALQAEAPTLHLGTRSASRRRKLWELNHRQHCPVIGTCLPIAELRRLARRAGLEEKPVTDYALHVQAVGESQVRSEFAEIIQRELERRFVPLVTRFSSVREADGLLALWRETAASGEVAGALWATLTHPACDEATDKVIYAEIHMLSHQVGGGHRADLKRLAALELELAERVSGARRDRERAQRRQSELEQALHSRDGQLTALRCAASEHEAAWRRLALQSEDLQRGRAAEAESRRRADAAERKLLALRGECTGLQRRLDVAGGELKELRIERQVAEAALGELATLAAAGAATCASPSDCRTCTIGQVAARLDGRCLLCIGGRENLVGHYRGLVEGLGGRFLHHDGGIEDNPKRLEATLASADAVVCQAACVSHAAYWKLKEYCKRHNKPCVYLKSAGVTSFARGVDLLVRGSGVGDGVLQ